jgi:hypothetical protein
MLVFRHPVESTKLFIAAFDIIITFLPVLIDISIKSISAELNQCKNELSQDILHFVQRE